MQLDIITIVCTKFWQICHKILQIYNSLYIFMLIRQMITNHIPLAYNNLTGMRG